MGTAIFVSAWCAHGRLPEHCEDCRLIAAYERGDHIPQPVTAAPPPDPVHANDDVYLDHGGGRYTFVAGGDPIPHALLDLPRVPVHPRAADKPRRRR